VRPICRTGIPLPCRCCILCIFFSTNISTEYFKHAAHSPFFSSKCRLFYNATLFGSCIIYVLHTGVLKFKCKKLRCQKVKRVKFASDTMSYTVLRVRWCNIILLNVHAPSEEKCDDSKTAFMRN